MYFSKATLYVQDSHDRLNSGSPENLSFREWLKVCSLRSFLVLGNLFKIVFWLAIH